MKTIIDYLKKYQTTVKTLFFASVLILVTMEVLRLRHSFSWSSIRSVIVTIAPLNLLAMLLLGLLAICPMLLYDVILNRQLGNQSSKAYLFETSWAINSINNLAGFAGLVDFGLRYSFYAKEQENARTSQVISRMMPYFMSGLSLLAILSFVISLVFPLDQSLADYRLLFLAASLYLPLVLFVSSRQKWTYFGQLPAKVSLSLLGVSLLDWLAVSGTFILIGLLMGLNLSIFSMLPLFTLAVIIGMVSMIPGGLGSFDLVMLTGLTSMGYADADVLAWILLFRLFYYVIPFALGLVFFLHQMGGRLNQRFQGIPQTILTNLLQTSQVFFIRLFAVFLILSALIPDQLGTIKWLAQLNPIHAQLIWQFPSLLLGLCFILLARAVKRKLAASLKLALVLFSLTIVYVNLLTPSLFTSLFLVLVLVMIWAIRDRLIRTHFVYAWEDISIDGAIITATVLALLFLGNKHPLHHHFALHLVDLSHYLTFWGHISLGLIIIALAFKLILAYLKKEGKAFGQVFDAKRYTKLLRAYGGDTDSGLAYLRDKQLYWYQEDAQDLMAFQFAIENNKLVVMGEPIGRADKLDVALTQFIQEAKAANYAPVFYEVGQATTMLLHEYGFDFMKFGESAAVDLSLFSLEGKKGRKFRTIVHKLEKQGFSFEISSPQHSDELLDRLEVVSDHWLAGRQEKGFSLGFFDRDYLQLSPLALVRNADQDIIAFANFMPGQTGSVATIDLMRYDHDLSPNGIMDYLFASLLTYFKDDGKASFDLGMAPLSKVGNLGDSFLQERLAYLVYTFTSRFYSFEGLRNYKQKFAPKWTAKYIAYPKKTWLLYDMIAIFKIDNRSIKK